MRHVPLRTCIGCGERGARAALLRLARGEDGVVFLDLDERAAGRGAWVHPRRSCVERVESGRALGRAFRGKARPPRRGALLDVARQVPGWSETE